MIQYGHIWAPQQATRGGDRNCDVTCDVKPEIHHVDDVTLGGRVWPLFCKPIRSEYGIRWCSQLCLHNQFNTTLTDSNVLFNGALIDFVTLTYLRRLMLLILCFFPVKEENYYPGLWDRVMEDSSNSITTQGLRSAVKQLLENDEAFVIIDWYPVMYQLAVRSGYCNWGFLNDRFYHSYASFPFPQGSPFVSVFSKV